MKVLVTGGAGYIGSVCIDELIKSKHEVYVIDNLSEGFVSAINENAYFYNGCLSDREFTISLLRDIKPSVVIHFAADAKVIESMSDPSKYFLNNVSNGINILDACIAAKTKKMIFSSTCATYGIPEIVPIAEDHPQTPINPYGESKLIFEKMLKWYHRIHGLSYTVFRYFNACGASSIRGQSHREMTHLIPNVIKALIDPEKHFTIYGDDYDTLDGTCIRDYIHVSDLASAHIKALEENTSGDFNLGTGNGYSVLDIVRIAEQLVCKKLTLKTAARRKGDPPILVADPRKAFKFLNWKPIHSDMKNILKTAYDWHITKPKGYN